MPTPTIVAGFTTRADTADVTTRNIAVPTYSPGDRIFVAVVFDSPDALISISGGGGGTWHALYKNIDVNGVSTFALFSKEATGIEGANYSIGTNVAERVAAVAWAVTNCAGVFHAVGTNQVGTSAVATVPAVTTYIVDALRISIVATDATVTTTPFGTATGHTKMTDLFATSGGGLTVQHKNLPATGTDPAQTVSLAASDQWLGITFALITQTEAHATKAGAYLEIGVSGTEATKAGAYLEIVENRVLTTKAGAYIEIIENRVLATKAGVYLEILEEPGDWLSLWIG